MKPIGLVLSFVNIALATSPDVAPFGVRPVVAKPREVHRRIYDGITAAEGQFPFMIYTLLRFSNLLYSKCSSSLVKPNWVLLAAHCIYFPSLRPENILLIGGKADLWEYINERISNPDFLSPMDEVKFRVQERRAAKFFIHPLFSENTLEHDVGLIRLTEPFRLGSIKVIPISSDKLKTPKLCTILGWGLTRNSVDLHALNYIENKRAATTAIGCRYKKTGPFLCLSKDVGGICMGDSGSPLVCDGKVWGVASHYYSPDEEHQCWDSQEEYYSELHPDLSWIRQVYGEEGGGGGGGGGNMSTESWKTLLLCLLASIWLSAKG